MFLLDTVCTVCDNKEEVNIGNSSGVLPQCTKCCGDLKKVTSPVGTIFKGDKWYCKSGEY